MEYIEEKSGHYNTIINLAISDSTVSFLGCKFFKDILFQDDNNHNHDDNTHH